MTSFKVFAIAAGMSLATFSAHAAPVAVDLTSWGENGNPNNNAGTWTVAGDGNSVVQSINGLPTVFFESGSNAQGTQLSGTITVGNTTDDDFVGFVLGYQDNEINSGAADFWLIDWKRGAQSGQTAGLALSHVSGNLVGTSVNVDGQWWQHVDPITEVQRATSLATTGYIRNQTYTFDLEFTSSLIEVKVDGVTELSYTSADNGGAFTDGAFGFYNYSQQNVTYAGITQQVAPSAAVPVPMALPLMASGLGALGFLGMRRRKG